MKFFSIGFIVCTIALPYAAHAEPITQTNSFFPYLPRVSIWGLVGEHLLAEGDAMLPLYGDQQTIFYIDAQGKTTFDTDWLGSMGAGVRSVLNTNQLLGAYLFVDRNVSSTSHLYWFLNPGFELMGKLWDFHANAYLPVSNKQNYLGTDFADNFNNYKYIHFQGHTQWDAILQEYESVGWGADAEVGRQVPGITELRVYLGGYHFNPENTSAINGVSTRLEYPITSNLRLNFRNSYDNVQHNSVLFGVSLSFGGIDKASENSQQSIQNRLLDPVQRHLATQTNANGEPIVTHQQVVAASVVEKDNIWFFQQSGGESFQDNSSCTAEHPCSGFDQKTIDGINQIAKPDPNFYFKPGQYTSFTPSTAESEIPLTITDDALFGRSTDYRQPEQSAIFNGAMILGGTDTLNSIVLHNDSQHQQDVGLTLQSGSTVTLDHTKVGTNDSLQGYMTGIKMQDSTLHITNKSVIDAYSNTNSPAIGINAYGQSAAITLNNSQINVSSIGKNNNFSATGIQSQGVVNNTINLYNSQINVNATATKNLRPGELSATGINVKGGNNTVELTGSSVINVAVNGPDIKHASATGIMADNGNTVGGQNVISMQGNSRINANAQVGLGNYWSSNTVDVVGISTNTGSLGINNIILSGNSKIDAEITDGDSGGIGDSLKLSGIYASGAAGSTNNIYLKDNSRISTLLDFDGTRSFSSHSTCGICALADYNVITLADKSAINMTAYISSKSSGQNEVDEFGILASGKTNSISLKDNALINIAADIKGGESNVLYLAGIGALKGNTNVNLANHSAVTAISDMNNNAISNFNFVTGITANGVNTINIADKSKVTAIGNIYDMPGYNTVKTQAINLDGTSTVNLSKKSLLVAEATADGKDPYSQAYGINSYWSKSVINDADTSLANIIATAIATDGEAVAKKINPYFSY